MKLNLLVLYFVISVIYSIDQVDEIKETKYIVFSNERIKVSEGGAIVSGRKVIIENPGNYLVTGESEEGNIIIKSSSVKLYLQDLILTSKTTAPIIVTSDLKDVRIINLRNAVINDLEDPSTTEGECAAIKVKRNSIVHFENNESFQLFGECNNIIRGVDNVKLIFEKSEGEYIINARKNAISSDGSIDFKGGIFNVYSEYGDAIKSSPNDNDLESEGKILVRNGIFKVKCYGDAFTATNSITILKGIFDIITQEGYNGDLYDEDKSSKGFKVTNDAEGSEIKIYSGEFKMNTADDAFRSNRDITIYRGKFTINSRDDAICAKFKLSLGRKNDPNEELDIKILNCYEGLEGMKMIIYSGKIFVTAENDGINASGVIKKTENNNNNRRNRTRWNDTNWNWNYSRWDWNNSNRNWSNPDFFPRRNRTRRNDTENGDKKVRRGSPGNSSYSISIFNGEIYVFSESDGIDSNGDVFVHGGSISIFSKGEGSDAPIDHNGNFTLFNTELLGVGSEGFESVHYYINKGNLMYAYYIGDIEENQILEITNEKNEVVKEGFITKKIDYIFYTSPTINENYHFYLIDEKNDNRTELTVIFEYPESGEDDDDSFKEYYDNYEDDYDEGKKIEEDKNIDDNNGEKKDDEKDNEENKESFSLFLKSFFLYISLILLL
jgi:hypothetical protein